jgi:hypothetical protein
MWGAGTTAAGFRGVIEFSPDSQVRTAIKINRKQCITK